MTLAEKSRQRANEAVQNFVESTFPTQRDKILKLIERESERGSIKFEYVIELGPVDCQLGGRRLIERLTEHFTSSDMGFRVSSVFYERGSIYQYVLYFRW